MVGGPIGKVVDPSYPCEILDPLGLVDDVEAFAELQVKDWPGFKI